jgi:hypothetical protein
MVSTVFCSYHRANTFGESLASGRVILKLADMFVFGGFLKMQTFVTDIRLFYRNPWSSLVFLS